MADSDPLDVLGLPSAEVRVIRYFLVRPRARPHSRKIQRSVGLGEGSVQQALTRLVKLGALERTEAGGRTFYSIVPASPAWRALRLLQSGTKDPAPLMREALSDVSGIEAAFIFGSMAIGDPHSESDVDVFVVERPSMDQRELNRRIAEVGLLLDRQVNVVRYTRDALVGRLDNPSDPAWGFLCEVLRRPKKWIVGGEEAFMQRQR